MKAKLFLFKLVLVTFGFNSCSSTLQITETKKTREMIFLPKEISKELDSNLLLKIEPIDAKSLNREISHSLSFDGGSSEKNSSYYTYLNENRTESSSERKLRESIIKIYEEIDNLAKSNKLTYNQAYLFKEKIYYYFVRGNNSFGNEKPNYNYMDDNIRGDINPYFSNGKYFSLYKLTLENKNQQVKDVKIENFQVFSEGELLYPFKNSYFENKFKDDKNQEKLKTIYRMNMPDNIRILNNQPIVKYFSTPALNNENQNLIVNYVNKENIIDFKFNVTTKERSTEVKLLQHKIKYAKTNGYPNFNIIQLNESDHLLKNDKFFLEKSNENIKLLTLNVDRYREEVKLTVTNFTTNNLTKNTIVVDNKN